MQLPDASLDIIFRSARTYRVWRDEPLSDATLHALYENSAPTRFRLLSSCKARRTDSGSVADSPLGPNITLR
jgi:hypothetical protein